jgi:hypothetical protein
MGRRVIPYPHSKEEINPEEIKKERKNMLGYQARHRLGAVAVRHAGAITLPDDTLL